MKIKYNNNIASKNKNDLQLSPVFSQLIKKLWDKDCAKSFPPTEFRIIVEKMNPLFKQDQKGDFEDVINFIIHKELKIPDPNKNKIVVQSPNLYDKFNSLNNFLSEFQD